MSAGDPAILADEADYLQWGKWVVRELLAAHFLAELDSSIVYYPTNASCALDCDVAYWKSTVDVALQKESMHITMPKPVGVYSQPEFAVDDLPLNLAAKNELHEAYKRCYAKKCARYEEEVAVFNCDLLKRVETNVRYAKQDARLKLWYSITDSLRGPYRWVICSVELCDVRGLLNNLDKMFEHTRPWKPASAISSVVSKVEPIPSGITSPTANSMCAVSYNFEMPTRTWPTASNAVVRPFSEVVDPGVRKYLR